MKDMSCLEVRVNYSLIHLTCQYVLILSFLCCPSCTCFWESLKKQSRVEENILHRRRDEKMHIVRFSQCLVLEVLPLRTHFAISQLNITKRKRGNIH